MFNRNLKSDDYSDECSIFRLSFLSISILETNRV